MLDAWYQRATRAPRRYFVSLRSDVEAVSTGRWDGFGRIHLGLLLTLATLFRLRALFRRWHVAQRAAGLAFFTAMSFVPMLLVLVVIADAFEILDDAGSVVLAAVLRNYMPMEQSAALTTLTTWVDNARTAYAGGIGLIIAFLAAIGLFTGYYRLINDLWHVPRTASLTHKAGIFVVSLVFVPTLLTLSAFFSARVGMSLGDGERIEWLEAIFLPMGLIFVVALAGIKALPKTDVKWWSAAVGALFAAVTFELGKYGFAFYVRELVEGTWFLVYGAVFLLPVFLIWLYVSSLIVALSAGLASVTQHLATQRELVRAGAP